MTIYKRIKDTVTALDAAQMYGLNVRSNGMTNCPFHEDHNPSLKLPLSMIAATISENVACFMMMGIILCAYSMVCDISSVPISEMW